MQPIPTLALRRLPVSCSLALITPRVRSMTGGFIFSHVCLFRGRGYPKLILPSLPLPGDDRGTFPLHPLTKKRVLLPHSIIPAAQAQDTGRLYGADGILLMFVQEDFLV